jgi:hypothetical protein
VTVVHRNVTNPGARARDKGINANTSQRAFQGSCSSSRTTHEGDAVSNAQIRNERPSVKNRSPIRQCSRDVRNVPHGVPSSQMSSYTTSLRAPFRGRPGLATT